MSDSLTLQQLVQNVERATNDFAALSLEVRTHLDNIAKERAALGELRERLLTMRASVREWEQSLWGMRWKGDGLHDICHGEERKAKAFHDVVQQLVWDLAEFRKEANRG